ncbi:MAG: 50S ribosomal protein L18 [Oxalobacteraceae bacterium]|nr:MAG: 50S ribosomal protein L18 [Oxalobacteraceae bacterium]
MSTSIHAKLKGRKRRQVRVRKGIFGTAQRPRLNVFRSAKHIYAQVIDDEQGQTLAASSTLTVGKDSKAGDKSAQAKAVGAALAQLCIAKDIAAVVFDRAGFRYHGRVRAVAEAAREGGLKF